MTIGRWKRIKKREEGDIYRYFRIEDLYMMFPSIKIQERDGLYVLEFEIGYGGIRKKYGSKHEALEDAKKYMKTLPRGAKSNKKHKKVLRKIGVLKKKHENRKKEFKGFMRN